MTIWCNDKFRTPSLDLNQIRHTISTKRQKLSSKKSRRVEEQIEEYDSTKFVNVGAAEKYTLISKNLSFIEEKGFHLPEDFFRKTISNKGCMVLCQPPRPTAIMVVREFYSNLASHVVKKVIVRGVLVDFSARSINEFYQLELMDDEAYNRT